MILSLMLMTLFVPILFSFFYTVCMQAKEMMQAQATTMQWMSFAASAREELATAEGISMRHGVCQWRGTDGRWVRYQVAHQRLLRQVAEREGKWRRGMTMLLGVQRVRAACSQQLVSLKIQMEGRQFDLNVRPRKQYNE